MNEYDLLIFDVDGTLVKDYNSHDLLPKVAAYFSALPKESRPDIALATNQGGVGLRYWMEQEGFGDPEKYPTKEQARARIFGVATQIADMCIYPHVYIAWSYQSKQGKWNPLPEDDDLGWMRHWRKPAPGMLISAMAHSQTMPDRTLFIGDSEEDRQAAVNAGCHFIEAKDFFNDYQRAA